MRKGSNQDKSKLKNKLAGLSQTKILKSNFSQQNGGKVTPKSPKLGVSIVNSVNKQPKGSIQLKKY